MSEIQGGVAMNKALLRGEVGHCRAEIKDLKYKIRHMEKDLRRSERKKEILERKNLRRFEIIRKLIGMIQSKK